MAKNVYDIIIRPIQTEKAVLLQAQNQYVFEVARDANKIEIKDAIQQVFGGKEPVQVTNVRVINMHRKARSRGRYAGYTTAWKKAIVTLAPGQAIEIFQGS